MHYAPSRQNFIGNLKIIGLRACLYACCALAGVFLSAVVLNLAYPPDVMGIGEYSMGVDASHLPKEEKEALKHQYFSKSIKPMVSLIEPYSRTGMVLGLLAAFLIEKRKRKN